MPFHEVDEPAERLPDFELFDHSGRLVRRKVRGKPLGVLRSVLNQVRLQLRARWRQRRPS